MKLPTPAVDPGAIAITLTTDATNGCYGVIVGAATAALPSGVYSFVENGVHRDAAGAQMVLSTIARPTRDIKPKPSATHTRQPLAAAITRRGAPR